MPPATVAFGQTEHLRRAERYVATRVVGNLCGNDDGRPAIVDADAANDFHLFAPALADFHAAADRVSQQGRFGLYFFRGNVLTADLDSKPYPAQGRIDAAQPSRVPGPVSLIQNDAHTVVGQRNVVAVAGRGHVLARRDLPGGLPGGGDRLGTIGPNGRRFAQALKQTPRSGFELFNLDSQGMLVRRTSTRC